MSVNSYLTQVSSKLVLSENEKNSMNASIHTLKSQIDSYFEQTIKTHFQFGSSTRGTILPVKADSNSDIDYMIVFNILDRKQEPQIYFEELRRFVDKNYSATEIKQSSPAVLLSLNCINLKLVPAINDSGIYKIPSPKSNWTEWIGTDPNSSKKDIQEKNKSNHNNIKPLVRLIKYWNALNNHPYISYSLEKHIVDRYFLLCSSLKDYFYSFWDEIKYNFNAAPHIVDMIDSAKKHVNRARDYERDNMPASAEKEIKKLITDL